MAVDSKAMGRRIKEARKRANMTQEKLAEHIGLSAVHVSNIESGSGRPGLDSLVDMANILHVSTDELLCDSVYTCKPVFQKEIVDTLADCDDYETRILAYLLKAAKTALRENKELGRKAR